MCLCTVNILLSLALAGAQVSAAGQADTAPAVPAHGGGGGGGGPIWSPGRPNDNTLANKPCVYTPAVFPRKYVSKPDFLRDPLLACNDTRLTATQQAACLKCISIRRRDTCLATVSDTFWGADEQSCTCYSLGINYPYMQGMSLDDNTCYVDVEVRLIHGVTPLVFPTAFFEWNLRGEFKTDQFVEMTLAGGSSCTLRAGTTVCRRTLSRPAYLKEAWMASHRTFWTNRLATVKEWQKSMDTCTRQDPETGTCSARPEPFKYDYTLKVVERPCRAYAPPIGKGSTFSEIPFAQPGHIMYPGGTLFEVTRANDWYLAGPRKVEWSVRVQRYAGGPIAPMVVGVVDFDTWTDACKTNGNTETCDYGALMGRMLQGTACYDYHCRGRYVSKNAIQDLRLVVAYKKFTYYPDQEWIINDKETPTQTVVTNIVAYR